MANVTIVDTTKIGWLTIEMNSYYPSRLSTSEYNIRKVDISSINLDNKDSNICVQMVIIADGILYFNNAFFAGDSYSYTVDLVNGVAPVSVNDLRDKILALL